MPRTLNQISKICRLADRLEDDIRQRELSVGDPYLSAREAAQMLGVSGSAANQALQLLEKRQVLVRQQRRGAFIAHGAHSQKPSLLSNVHFLIREDFYKRDGLGADGTMLGIQSELPTANVRATFLSPIDENATIRNLIDEALRAENAHGFVLVRASYEAQQMLAQCGLPAVVYGSLYPAVDRLASIDYSMQSVASVLGRYLLERHRRRVAVFSRQVVLPGDHAKIDTLGSIFGADNLIARYLPEFDEVIEAEAARLLALDNPPTGFVCQSGRFADAAARAIKARNLTVGTDVDVVVCSYYLRPGERADYPYARTTLDSKEIGTHLAGMLIAQAKNESFALREIIPVELELPKKDN